MRIAVMTWFRYYNYGTALQVSALCEYLRKKGHSVDVIDYIPQRKGESNIHSYRLIDYVRLKTSEKRKKKIAVGKPYEREDRTQCFLDYLDLRISLSRKARKLSELQSLNKEYDSFLCGSDQIWAPSIFDPHFFLDFVYDEKKMIAYAPSIGLPEIKDAYVREAMRKLISRYHHLSVREETGAELIEELIGNKPVVVSDPSLLLTADEWIEYAGLRVKEPDKKYVLAYMLGKEEKHWQQIYRVAEEKNLDVVVVPTFEEDVTRVGCYALPVGPREFLELIAGAEYVCTDSYHGTIFSLIFEKPFSVFERFSKSDAINQNSRIYNLLEKTGLKDRLIGFRKEYRTPGNIDFIRVQELLHEEITKSEEYLNNALMTVTQTVSRKSRHVLEEYTLCCGCGACAVACPVEAIAVKMDEKGFWKAHVDEKTCVGCGKCKSVCPFESQTPIPGICDAELYSYKDRRQEVLMRSSSGGAAFALSEMLLQQGYSIVGCEFDPKTKRARHCIVTDAVDLSKLQGSKYTQSYFAEILHKIAATDCPIAVFGTPCQIASVKNVFSEKTNILCVELICHGVPTAFLMDRYVEYLKEHYSISGEETDISFRWKPKGWRERHVRVAEAGREIILGQYEDMYFRMFETTHCYMDACYDCRWRDASVADLRLGDYWGTRFAEDKTGVSMVVCLTEKGQELLDTLSDKRTGELLRQPIEDMIKYQQMENEPKPLFHDELIAKLSGKVNLRFLEDKYVFPYERLKRGKVVRAKRVLRLLCDENIRGIH